MTQVTFHVPLPQVMHYAVRLLRKAHHQQARVLVHCASPQTMSWLDQQLWALPDAEFLVHACWPPKHDKAWERVPIWLTCEPVGEIAMPVHVNLTQTWLDWSVRMKQTSVSLEKVIELVSHEPQHVASARQRWRQYQALGFDLIKHSLA